MSLLNAKVKGVVDYDNRNQFTGLLVSWNLEERQMVFYKRILFPWLAELYAQKKL